MHRWLMLIMMVAAIAAAQSSPNGSAMGGRVGTNVQCDQPDANHTYLCFGDDGFIYASRKGSPYAQLPQGIQGDKGDPGQAATISVGTVVQTAPGTMPTVNNSGTSNAARFDFTFPAPPTGTSTLPTSFTCDIKITYDTAGAHARCTSVVWQ